MPRFERTYRASLDIQSDLADHVSDALETLCSDEDVRDRALLVATELFSNSVEHSCSYDPTKQVTVELWPLDGEGVAVRITDTGGGFSALPSAELPDDPLSEGGRGLFLIDALAQDVIHEDGGRRVTAKFYSE